MNVLLTGGAGYIGSHVALKLIEEGHEVSIVDNLTTGSENLIPKQASFLKCNINNKEKISNLLKNNKFDAIMHFAAFIQVEESVKNPNKYFENNKDNTINFFETCYENKLTNLIFSSTAAVYGNNKTNKPISEKMDLNPLNPYGKSKLDVENYLLKNSDRFNYIILRYFNVAGADPELRSGLISKKSSHLIKIASEVAIGKRKKITIYGNDYKTFDGTAVRDYIHVSDLADIHINILNFLKKNKVSNIFNCGYGKGYSVKEVIDAANNITNGSIKYEYGKRRLGDSEILISDVSKLNNLINWEPKYNNLNVILKTAIDWEKKINEKNF
tara:strand:- start:2021 stop:3004 length:984 start_codon:yes stop_codon:yes gene_type:complete